MNAGDKFFSITALICGPTRTRMFRNLLEGRTYTKGEFSIVAYTSSLSSSIQLSKLLEKGTNEDFWYFNKTKKAVQYKDSFPTFYN